MVYVTRHDTQMIWTDANIYDTGLGCFVFMSFAAYGKKCIT